MLNKKLTFIYLSFMLVAGLVFTTSSTTSVLNSGGNTSGDCSNCHTGATDPNGGVTITGLPTSYTPNTSYMIKFCLEDATVMDADGNGVAGGFTLRYENAMGPGTWTNIDPLTRVLSTSIGHDERNVFGDAGDETPTSACWDVQWNSPTAGNGTVDFYWAANAVNFNFNNGAGDHGGYNNQFQPIMVSEAVLPVDLTAFNAIAKNKKVQLNWSTAQEINSDYFAIERSVDGSDFEQIGKVEAALNSSKSVNYEFEDKVLLFNQTLYYRLRQVDIDGSIDYSPVRSVRVFQSQLQIAKLYPNPVFQQRELNVVIENSGEITNAHIILTDVLGHAILQEEMNLNKGENALNFNLNELSKGQYFIIVKNDHTNVAQEMLVIQ